MMKESLNNNEDFLHGYMLNEDKKYKSAMQVSFIVAMLPGSIFVKKPVVKI